MQATNFEWQRHSPGKLGVSHFDELLKFLDLQLQAAESSTHESTKSAFKSKMLHVSKVESGHSSKLAEASCSKPTQSTKHGVSCLACKVRKHPLYMCSKFKALPCGQHATMAFKNELCINCLKPGHFQSQRLLT